MHAGGPDGALSMSTPGPVSFAGLTPTFRHLLIALTFLIAFLGLVVPVSLWVTGGGFNALSLPAFAAPPLLALLVAAFDRDGPIKNWAALILLVMLYPALAIYHDVYVAADYFTSGRAPTYWATFLLNATLVPAAFVHGRRMIPLCCPSCHKRRFIPLTRLFKNDRRITDTRWCASCGGLFWKDSEGQWRVERRKTWLDARPGDTARPH